MYSSSGWRHRLRPSGVESCSVRTLLGAPVSDDREFLLPPWSIRWLVSCASTSDVLKAAVRAGESAGLVIATTHQTAGRGRRGHAWITAPGEGLALSALWQGPMSAATLGWVGLATGVAMAQALESVGINGVQLKWPNDLMHDGAKLGGILIETVAHAAPPGRVALAIGIGINRAGGARLSAHLGRAVTDLAAGGALDVPPERLVDEALAALGYWLPVLESGDVDRLREAWSARDGLSGRQISVADADRRVDGLACGIAADGGLQVRTPRGLQVLHAGEVSIGALAP